MNATTAIVSAPVSLTWKREAPAVWTTGPVNVTSSTYMGEYETTVRMRVDGRDGTFRVDCGKPIAAWWEAVDRSEGFATAHAAKAFAARWVAAVSEQKTLDPRVTREAEGPGVRSTRAARAASVAA